MASVDKKGDADPFSVGDLAAADDGYQKEGDVDPDVVGDLSAADGGCP